MSMLNQRCMDIIQKFIDYDGENNIKELEKFFKISERTVRNDIDKIDRYLLENSLSGINKTYGGVLKIEDIEKVKELFNNESSTELSSEERVEYIVIRSLLEKKLNLTHFSEELDVSRTTITSDLKDVKRSLDEFGIELEADHKNGFLIKGSEDSIRKLFLKIYMRTNGRRLNTFVEKSLSQIRIENTKGIEIFLSYIQKKLDIVMSDEAFKVINLYLEIMIRRIQEGYNLTKVSNENFLRGTKEYEQVKEFLALLNSYYEIEISEFEILTICDFILGSHTYNFNSKYFDNWIEIELLVKKMVQKFNKEIDVDISQDKILLDGLINHIKPTIYRIKNNIELQNSIYNEVIESYPDVFFMVKKSILELEDFIGKKMGDDEISFLVMYFKAALDRNRKNRVKNILVVCSLGYGSSKLLGQQLKDSFAVNIVDTIPFNLLKRYQFENKIDLIVTTLDIKEDLKIKTIKVSPILSEDDLKVLRATGLAKSRSKYYMSEVINSIEKHCDIKDIELLKKELNGIFGERLINNIITERVSIKNANENSIFLNLEADDWQEAINKSGDILHKLGYCSENYKNEMIEVINSYGSYMILEKGVAIPHAKIEEETSKTGFAIIKLKNPVVFPDGEAVDILFPFSSKDGKEHLELLIDITEMLSNFGFAKFLRDVKSKDNILKFINLYERSL